MMEQSSEPLLLVFPCSLPHTMQSLGHPYPALGRLSVRFHDVLLGHGPSLHHLRRHGFPWPCSAASQVSGRRWRACALATVRRSNCTCSFPAYSFHEDSRFRDAKEGINWIRFTSPYSPYNLVSGSCRHP